MTRPGGLSKGWAGHARPTRGHLAQLMCGGKGSTPQTPGEPRQGDPVFGAPFLSLQLGELFPKKAMNQKNQNDLLWLLPWHGSMPGGVRSGARPPVDRESSPGSQVPWPEEKPSFCSTSTTGGGTTWGLCFHRDTKFRRSTNHSGKESGAGHRRVGGTADQWRHL